jgi:hypothetical protein
MSAGAIVLGTGPNIYDRFVSSRAFCTRDEQIEPRWLATAEYASVLRRLWLRAAIWLFGRSLNFGSLGLGIGANASRLNRAQPRVRL